jgi:hypothetical protein
MYQSWLCTRLATSTRRGARERVTGVVSFRKHPPPSIWRGCSRRSSAGCSSTTRPLQRRGAGSDLFSGLLETTCPTVDVATGILELFGDRATWADSWLLRARTDDGSVRPVTALALPPATDPGRPLLAQGVGQEAAAPLPLRLRAAAFSGITPIRAKPPRHASTRGRTEPHAWTGPQGTPSCRSSALSRDRTTLGSKSCNAMCQ